MKEHKPTLQDVADSAGVSTATVSRCLNFPDKVAESTRARVMDAVRRLGYAPDFGARVMAARRTNTIGVVIPTMENAIFARGLQAVQTELQKHGYTMLVASTSYQAELEDQQIRALVARGADGLLLIGHDRSPEIDAFLATQDVPCVVMWAYAKDATQVSVGFDNAAAMKTLALRVIGYGHRHLGFITAPTAQNDRTLGRLRGVEAAMAETGLDPASLTVIETPYGIDNGSAAFGRIIDRTPRPTAVMCGNDVLAVGALRRARQLGLAVPQMVSITGFDDIEIAQVAFPALTTVRVPHLEMGRRAAQTLVEMVRTGQRPASVRLDADLILRDTLSRAPG